LGHWQSPAIPFREAEQGTTFPTLFANVSGADIPLPFRKYKTNLMMMRRQNHTAGVQELVAQFVSIGLAQYDARMLLMLKNITGSIARWRTFATN
jgi:hypothetical protein